MATETTASTLSLTGVLSYMTQLVLGIFMVLNFVSMLLQLRNT